MRCLAFEMLRQCRREDCRRFVLMYAGIAPSFHSPRLRPFERERERERGRERERKSSREKKIQCQVGRKVYTAKMLQGGGEKLKEARGV